MESAIITGRNEVVAKVIFLQASLCPQGGVYLVPGGVWSGGSGLGGRVWSGGWSSRGVSSLGEGVSGPGGQVGGTPLPPIFF